MSDEPKIFALNNPALLGNNQGLFSNKGGLILGGFWQ